MWEVPAGWRTCRLQSNVVPDRDAFVLVLMEVTAPIPNLPTKNPSRTTYFQHSTTPRGREIS